MNRHIRNILFDVGNVQHWSRILCTTERVLNNSIKQPLGASPNTLLFGNAFSVDRTLLTQIDQDVADGPHSVITEQVTNGVATRMAVLYLLAGAQMANE